MRSRRCRGLIDRRFSDPPPRRSALIVVLIAPESTCTGDALWEQPAVGRDSRRRRVCRRADLTTPPAARLTMRPAAAGHCRLCSNWTPRWAYTFDRGDAIYL